MMGVVMRCIVKLIISAATLCLFVIAQAATLPILLAYPKPGFAEAGPNALLLESYEKDFQACSSEGGQYAIWGIDNTRGKNTATTKQLSGQFNTNVLTWTVTNLYQCLNATQDQLYNAKPNQVGTPTKTNISLSYQAGSTSYAVSAENLTSQLPTNLDSRQFVGCADDRDDHNNLICCYTADGSTNSCNW